MDSATPEVKLKWTGDEELKLQQADRKHGLVAICEKSTKNFIKEIITQILISLIREMQNNNGFSRFNDSMPSS